MARSMFGRERVPKTHLRAVLRNLLSRVFVESSGTVIAYPASWDDIHVGSVRYRAEERLARRQIIPGTAKQVALDLALARVTDEPPLAATLHEAVDRLYEGHMEVRF